MICTNPSIVSKACENTAYFTNLGRIILDLGPHISQNNPAFFHYVCVDNNPACQFNRC